MERLSHSLSDTNAFAGGFVKDLAPHHESASVVALYGDLGSGKTTFVQAVAKAIGVRATIISPTFVLERAYTLKDQPFARLLHIDCYRIEKSGEMHALNWDEKIRNPKNIIFVEWAERIEDTLPPNTVRIYFEHVGENKRKISIQYC